jgi:hypothetical protein
MKRAKKGMGLEGSECWLGKQKVGAGPSLFMVYIFGPTFLIQPHAA